MKKTLTAIDIKQPAGKPIYSKGVAHFRITEEFREFIDRCEKKHGVIGFEYTKGELSLGVLLGDKGGEE